MQRFVHLHVHSQFSLLDGQASVKGLVDKERNDLVAKNVGRMLLSGILVSLLSAGIVGIFVWGMKEKPS